MQVAVVAPPQQEVPAVMAVAVQEVILDSQEHQVRLIEVAEQVEATTEPALTEALESL